MILPFALCVAYSCPDRHGPCVCQDPVYGKGKLAEIQGLILGMLDTFTYEQVKHHAVVGLCFVAPLAI